MNNRLRSAETNISVMTFPAKTCQPLELESCSSPLKCGKSSCFNKKWEVLGLGFFVSDVITVIGFGAFDPRHWALF